MIGLDRGHVSLWVALLLVSRPAHALDCAEILRMVDLGLPEPIVVQTIVELPGSLSDTDISCLRARHVSTSILDAAQKSVGTAAPPTAAEPTRDSAPAPRPVPKKPAPVPAAAKPPASGFKGISCIDARAMIAAKIPLAVVQETVSEGGGLTDGTLAACLAVAEPPAGGLATEPPPAQPSSCQALSGSLPTCNLDWSQLRLAEATPAATPMEEDHRVQAQKTWSALCVDVPSAVYPRAAACVRDEVESVATRNRAEAVPAVKEAAQMAAALVRASSMGAWVGTASAPLAVHAGVFLSPYAEPGGVAASAKRAQSFREQVYEQSWAKAATTLEEETLLGEHGAEARILLATSAALANTIAMEKTRLSQDPWADMGVVRSRAWLPWLYAADSLARSCTPFALPEEKGTDRLMALVAALPLADDTMACLDRALPYFDAHPMAESFRGFETAAGFDPVSTTAPRDRLVSTAAMMARVHRDNRAQVASARATAESLVTQLKEKLPKPAVEKFDKTLEQPPARCALAAAAVPRLQEEIKRFDEVVSVVDSIETRIAWYDPDLTAALAKDRKVLEDAVAAATKERDATCLGAAKKAAKGDGLP